MTENLVIIFAYHFPPENTIGGARPFRFAKYLSKLGYRCRVFTAACQAGRDDPNTVWVPDPSVQNPRRGLGWQMERAARKFLVPGEVGIRWSYHAYRAARIYVRANPLARIAVFSTFPPVGPHLAAWRLARDTGLPWIADFRDPLGPDGLPERDIAPLQNRVLGKLEKLIMQRADAVIANTDAVLFKWKEKFPFVRDRSHLIWNGFDPEERVEPLPIPSRPYKLLSHVGELYNGRSPTPILESVARLIAGGRLSAGKVRICLIGPTQDGTLPGQDFLRRAKAQGWLEIETSQIPQQRARLVVRTSDCLLLLQPQSAVQVPGKLFEYLQIGRPILAFVQHGSPSEMLLEQSGVPHQCVYADGSEDEIDSAVLRFFNLPFKPITRSPWFEHDFNVQRQTQILDTLIRSLHGQTARAHSDDFLKVLA